MISYFKFKKSYPNTSYKKYFMNNIKYNFKYGKIEPKSRKTDAFMAYVAAMTIEEEIPEYQELAFFEPIIF